ncbi:MAG TPA: amidohydrolase family protein, partial [Acidimicrobiales bacterium]|nr:amidohydrolase family protein [Acidimicrobiales bacterium]
MSDLTVIRAARWVDVDDGAVKSPAVIVVQGNRIVGVNPAEVPVGGTEIDLGDLTVLPGLMDMELNLLIGGPENPDGLPNPLHGVVDDPVFRTLRGTVNARVTLMAGFTTVRNLGLMVKTGGYILDVALRRAIDQGWVVGPRIRAAGHAISPTGGHLDPTMVRNLAPHIMPLSVEEGIANGVPEVRKAVRYQIKHGVDLIKISASGGVMSHNTQVGQQQYSDEELAAICDEAHRAGLRVAAHAIGDEAVRGCIRAGVDCIEHGFLASDETIQLMVERGTFLVTTTYLAEGMAVAKYGDPVHKRKAEYVFPRAKQTLHQAIEAGVKIACGSDAPGIAHGSQANEIWALVDRGMTPM